MRGTQVGTLYLCTAGVNGPRHKWKSVTQSLAGSWSDHYMHVLAREAASSNRKSRA